MFGVLRLDVSGLGYENALRFWGFEVRGFGFEGFRVSRFRVRGFGFGVFGVLRFGVRVSRSGFEI